MSSAHPAGCCRVVDEAKLPATAGGASLICSEIQRAMSAKAPGVEYSVEIRVISPARLTAAFTVGGRTLPVQNFAVMDRNLSEQTIKRFADAVVAAVTQAR